MRNARISALIRAQEKFEQCQTRFYLAMIAESPLYTFDGMQICQ